VASDVGELLRVEVARRANYRCEYCLLREEDAGFPHQIDHIISRKHGGLTSADNLAFACMLCNRHKGTDLSSIDELTGGVSRLFHPRRDRWTDHFLLTGAYIGPTTSVGRVTVCDCCG
jgi:hypothetical protein